MPRCARSRRRPPATGSSRGAGPTSCSAAGGYVGRPDGRRRGASTHPGRADRGRRPPRPREPARGAVRQARLPLVSRSRAASRRSTCVTGRPIPDNARGRCRATRRGAQLGLPAEGPVLLVAGARAGARSLNELAVEAFGASGPAVLHISRRARLRRAARRASRGRTTGCCRCSTDSARPRRRRTSRSCAAAATRLGARGRRAAGGARPVSVRDRRPPDEERALLRGRGRRDRDPGERARPRARDGCARCSTTRPGSRR